MYKEIIISIIIIIFIISIDFITQNYTKKTIKKIDEIANSLKQSLLEKNKEEIEKKLEEIDDKIKKTHNNLAYYIEHDELEKIETNFIEAKIYAKTEDYNLSISKLERMIFILDHIADKYSFSLENIF